MFWFGRTWPKIKWMSPIFQSWRKTVRGKGITDTRGLILHRLEITARIILQIRLKRRPCVQITLTRTRGLSGEFDRFFKVSGPGRRQFWLITASVSVHGCGTMLLRMERNKAAWYFRELHPLHEQSPMEACHQSGVNCARLSVKKVRNILIGNGIPRIAYMLRHVSRKLSIKLLRTKENSYREVYSDAHIVLFSWRGRMPLVLTWKVRQRKKNRLESELRN